MKNNLKKEILYFLSSIFITLIVFHFVFGLTNLKTESVLDINVHDTYFVIEKTEFLPLFSLVCLFFIYLTRIIIQKFKNRLTLWIYSTINLILLITFPYILSFALSITVNSGWTVYPPLSALESQNEVKESSLDLIFPVIYGVYIILMLLTGLGIFKLGKLYNGTAHNSC